jgi:hypothetical protein
MAVTYGFYNSLNGDRRYNAIQMSSIFDGIIKDGIFMSLGTSMMVKARSGMTVSVGAGRAWFDHTWTLNDAELPIDIPEAEVLLNRIDSVVLDIDAREASRANSIIIVKGSPSSNPVAPTLIRTADHNQYALCNVFVTKGVSAITQANITNLVGSGSTPFITGILETINIESLVAKWESQWNQWFAANQNNATTLINKWTADWTNFYLSQTADMLAEAQRWSDQWETWFNAKSTSADQEISQWESGRKADFDIWFAQLQAILDGDVAAKLANEVLELNSVLDRLSMEHILYRPIYDSAGDKILDGGGVVIESQTEFATVDQLPWGGILYGIIHSSDGDVLIDNLGRAIQGRTIFVTQ